MKIPQSIRDTGIFKNIRRVNHNLNDTVNLYRYKLSDTANTTKQETSNKKTKDQLDVLYSSLKTEYENRNIPEYVDTNPLISIILINKDNDSFLDNLLSSLSNVTLYYPNIEVVIVDDKKNHEIIEEKFSQLNIHLIELDYNLSFIELKNLAVSKARGEYLLFSSINITLSKGVLNYLLDLYDEYDDVGAITSRIMYNDPEDIDNSCRIFSEGVCFRYKDNELQGYYKNNNEYVDMGSSSKRSQIAALPREFLFIKKSTFIDIGQFSTDYKKEYASLDLTLRLHNKGFKNYYDANSMVFINRDDSNSYGLDYNSNDYTTFINRWESYLKKNMILDKINADQLFTTESLNVGFIVTEDTPDATAGDYFTALELSSKLRLFGWNTKFYAQKSDENWYFIDSNTDVLIVLLERYNINRIQSNNQNLITVAWARNWFDEWITSSCFKKYDIILASSSNACQLIKDRTGRNAHLFPLATDIDRFNSDVKPVDKYKSDYCFTGSYWSVNRDIISALDPSSLDYTFKLYGDNWQKVDQLKEYSQGFVSYEDMPDVYASTKIVLDDANFTTKVVGSVNSRVFDAISSDRLVITNNHIGNVELFDGLLPEYDSRNDLTNHLNYFLENSEDREILVNKLKIIVYKNHTYLDRAKTLKKLLLNFVSS